MYEVGSMRRKVESSYFLLLLSVLRASFADVHKAKAVPCVFAS